MSFGEMMNFLVGLVVLAIIIAFVPLGIMWCLDTLFQLDLAYSGKEWFACFALYVLFLISAKTSTIIQE